MSDTEKELQFLRTTVEVNVDARLEIIHYRVIEMYNEIQEDGTAKIVHKEIATIDKTWDEVEKEGGPGGFSKKLKEQYNIEDW